MSQDHPAPWKVVPIGSLTTDEKDTGRCIEDANGHWVMAIRSSKRSSKWNGPVPKEETQSHEALLQRIVDAVNAKELSK